MNTEKIERLVNGFIEQLELEFAQLSKDIRTNAHDAGQEVEMLGLSQEDVPHLVFDLADPMTTIKASQERCRMHSKHMFDIFEGLDPDEEKLARYMVVRVLRELQSDMNSLFSSDD